MKLKALQLSTPLFLGKTNLGDKLDCSKRDGLEMEFRAKEQMCYVRYNGEIGMIPAGGVSCMVPEELNPMVKVIPKIHANIEGPKAQVSSPTGDLLTPGQGRTGQEK